ncbi:MAG: DUF1559 domain-containing protein [Gemmataceae bacterium]
MNRANRSVSPVVRGVGIRALAVVSLVSLMVWTLTHGADEQANPIAALAPADGLGFLSVHVSKLHDSEPGKEVQKILQMMPKSEREGLGLPIADIDYAGIIILEVNHEAIRFVVAREPIVRARVLERLVPKGKLRKYEGKEIVVQPAIGYRLGGDDGATDVEPEEFGPAVCFLSDRAYVTGLYREIQKYIGFMKGSNKKGVLSATLAEANKHDVAFCFDMKGTIQQVGRPSRAEYPEAALLDTELISLTGDIGKPWKLQASVRFKNKDLAATGKKIGTELIQTLPALLDREFRRADAPSRRMFQGPFEEIKKAVKNAKFEQDGATVKVEMQADIQLAINVEDVKLMRKAADRARSGNHLRMLGICFHNWASTFQDNLPPAALCDKNGKPLLSWRVALLPYIEHDALYKEFKLDEPWDSPHNKKLLAKMPQTYRLPGAGEEDKYVTHYRVYTGSDTLYPGKAGKIAGGMGIVCPFTIGNIPDGTSNTILLVESAEAVPWTKPEALVVDPKKPLPKLYERPEGFLALMGDGRLQIVNKKVTEKTMRNAINPKDGLALGKDFYGDE